MREVAETLQQVSLGLFVNGSYGLMQGDLDIANSIIVISSVIGMFLFNKLKRKYEDGRE